MNFIFFFITSSRFHCQFDANFDTFPSPPISIKQTLDFDAKFSKWFFMRVHFFSIIYQFNFMRILKPFPTKFHEITNWRKSLKNKMLTK